MLKDMTYVYSSIKDKNLRKKRKSLIVFDNMMADIISDKKFTL